MDTRGFRMGVQETKSSTIQTRRHVVNGLFRVYSGCRRRPWRSEHELFAGVAELVQAHGLGPCGGNPMEVRVLPPALRFNNRDRKTPPGIAGEG